MPRAEGAARPTMRDVAARAGVGIKSVSRVVNGEYVRPETERVIAEAIAELGFSRNDSAAMLADNVEGAREGVAHLIAAGHRRIGFIADTAEIFTAAERLRGYQDALGHAGLEFDPGLVEMAPPTQDSVTAALERMLEPPAGVTAVFTGNSHITMMFLRAMTGRPSGSTCGPSSSPAAQGRSRRDAASGVVRVGLCPARKGSRCHPDLRIHQDLSQYRCLPWSQFSVTGRWSRR